MQVTIVVPCYNEAHRLQKQRFRDFLAVSNDVAFIFVDDGSKDATLSVLEEVRRGFENRVAILHQEPNAGKGEAVRKGLLEALQRGDGEMIGFWDADLATPLDAIRDLLQIGIERPQVQMVFGARVKLLGREIERRAI